MLVVVLFVPVWSLEAVELGVGPNSASGAALFDVGAGLKLDALPDVGLKSAPEALSPYAWQLPLRTCPVGSK